MTSSGDVFEQKTYSRRAVLRGGIVAAGAAAWSMRFPLPDAAAQALATLRPDFSAMARRREDFLHLRFLGYNLGRRRTGGLGALNPNRPSYLVVVFPPQAVAEASVGVEDGASLTRGPAPVATRVAGETRLAFEVPTEVLPLPLTLEALLSWTALAPSVVPAALPPGALRLRGDAPPIRMPGPTETRIELPWRLLLSPHVEEAFVHSLAPVTHGERTELWHTRLAARPRIGSRLGQPDEWRAAGRAVRAVWATDPGYPGPVEDPKDEIKPLTPGDRRDLVALTSDFSRTPGPKPVQAHRLMLSSLGGWLDVSGEWAQREGADLVAWEHRAPMGRDQRVVTTRIGYLLPYGHLAAEVVVATREVVPDTAGNPRAQLYRRTFIQVIEPSRRYAGAALGQPQEGRGWPFTRLDLATRRTPAVTPAAFGTFDKEDAFVPTLGGAPYAFQAVGYDWDGTAVSLSLPVVFVASSAVFPEDGPGKEEALRDAFAALAELPSAHAHRRLRQLDLAGQRVAIAQTASPGDTAVDLNELVVAVDVADPAIPRAALLAAGQPPFSPAMAEAQVALPAAEGTGATASPTAPPLVIQLDVDYLEKGLKAAGEVVEGNAAAVFAAVKGSGIPLGFPADAAAGLVTPNLNVTGLSRELGVLSGPLDALKAGSFDPKMVFGELSASLQAKLLGGVALSDVIKTVDIPPPAPSLGADGELRHEALVLTTRTVHGEADETTPPIGIETKLDWDPPLQTDPLEIFEPHEIDGLTVDARTYVALTGEEGNASTYEVRGELRDFTIHLIGKGKLNFLDVRFRRLAFSASAGEKPSLDPDIADVRFAGPLTFVNGLQEFLRSTGLPGGSALAASSGGGAPSATGPSIDVTPEGITAGYGIELPAIGVGVFSLANLALHAGVHIPFDGRPVRARFAFSSREDPFNLTVSLFSGGGFVALALGADELESLEVALEFGAQAAIDLVVASGSVSLMAGIYLKRTLRELPSGESVSGVELTGYLRLRGELSVLGIVSISANFEISFTYDSSDGSAYGRGIFAVEIDVVLFSDTVEIEIERRFAGGSGSAGAAVAAGGTDAEPMAFAIASSPTEAAPPPPPTFADQVRPQQWASYAGAFAAV